MQSQIQPTPNQTRPISISTVQEEKNHFSPKLLIFAVSVLTILAVFLGYYYLVLPKRSANPDFSHLQRPTQNSHISTTQPTPTAYTPTSTPVFSPNAYYIHLQFKPGEQEPTTEEPGQPYFIGEFLVNAFGLPKSNDFKDRIPYIARNINNFDDTQNKNRFTDDYYIILKEGILDVHKIYDGGFFTVKAEPVLQSLEPYIKNPEYCETDSDCTLRYNMCSYGAYNQYQPFYDVFGCGPPTDKTGYIFDTYDESLQCVTNVEFSGSQCINHTCTELGRKVSCKND